ncbi:protein bric-a-brac 1 isoform X2 [Anabrus simplex]|uniref:protein bric-a-brac 1 isoform X2 n=1 Tax=Anabrus simplex TaxID=316456 RepID=UPI0035A319DC
MAEVDSEQFSLRWNNFHNNLTTGFHSLLEEEDLVDVTLAADGQFVQAHRIVLSVCSPYFKQLFKANPCKHPIVILKDVCHKELEAILQFMYQGEVNVRQEELATFLKTAEMLQIKGLTGHDTQENSSPAPVPNPVHRPVREREKPPVSEPAIVKQEDQLPRPYKRPRTEPAPVSSIVPISTPTHNPVPVPPPVSPRPSSDDSSRAEFVEITNPKTEPVDYGSDIEEVIETKHPSREDPLVQLLQGESSQSHVDTSQGPAPGLFASIPGLPQDSGGSQDGVQGFFGFGYKESPVQKGYHSLVKTEVRDVSNRRVRKRCIYCYEENKKSMGSFAANLKTSRISTFCITCPGQPFICVTCFTFKHNIIS